MNYLDSSVVLAHVLAEDRKPPRDFWEQPAVSSRLLEYEVWNRLHRMGLFTTHGETLRTVLQRLSFLELERTVLRRAREPFPGFVRTLDAIHLASAWFLRGQDPSLVLATYDERQAAAGRAIGLKVVTP